MKKIGEFIRSLRKKSKYTAIELSDELYVTPQCLNYWETGKRDLNLSSLAILSQKLKFKVIINNGEIRMEENTDMVENKVVVNVIDGFFDIRAVDVIKELGENYCLIAVYRPLLSKDSEQTLKDEKLYFDNKKDFIRCFPESEIQIEYQIIDKKTGFVPEGIKMNNEYAFKSIDDAETDYMNYLSPALGLTPLNDEIIIRLSREDTNSERYKKLVDYGLRYPELYVIRKKVYVMNDGDLVKIKTSNITDNATLVEGFSIVDSNGEQLKGTMALYRNINTVLSDYDKLSSYKLIIEDGESECIKTESYKKCLEDYNFHMSDEYKNLVE